jgi:N-acetyltransferase 10
LLLRNSYEGTGRSLSLKLLQRLRTHAVNRTSDDKAAAVQVATNGVGGRKLYELTLEESIRYARGDPVEAWLNRLLCLDVQPLPMGGCAAPADCHLFYVNRDTLFSYHAASERFLQRIMAIYVAAHYKVRMASSRLHTYV